MLGCHSDVDDEKTMEFYKLTVEVQLAMYNGLVMAWREKVRNRQVVLNFIAQGLA